MKLGLSMGIGLFGVGLAGGMGAAPDAGAAGAPAAASTVTAARDDGALCAGGMEAPLAATLEPVELRSVDGKAQLRLELGLTSRLAGAPRYRYAVEVVDDRGRPVVAPLRSAPLRFAAARTTERASIETPAGLADGFYQLRVTAAAVAGAEEAASLATSYFEVTGGDVVVIDVNEFLARSDANLGVKQ